MVNTASQIERLEFHIDELTASIARSRKLMLLGQLSAAGGVVALVAFAFGTAYLGIVWLSVSVALTLGGLVLTGASQSSTEELQRALLKAQIDLNEAIDELALRDVSRAD